MASEPERGGWKPGYAVAPGAVIAEHLEARGWSQSDFACHLGRSPTTISDIIAGTHPIDPETALALEQLLGMKAEIWSGIEADWRTFLAKMEDEATAAKTVIP